MIYSLPSIVFPFYSCKYPALATMRRGLGLSRSLLCPRLSAQCSAGSGNDLQCPEVARYRKGPFRLQKPGMAHT